MKEPLQLAVLLYVTRATWNYGLPCPQEVIARRVWKLRACVEVMDEVEWDELFSLSLLALVVGAVNMGAEGGGTLPQRMWFVSAIVKVFETIGLACLRRVKGW